VDEWVFFTTPAWTGVRFTDNGDGTVTDNLTALIWLKDASCSDLAGTDSEGRGSWTTALAAPDSLADGTCGLEDGSSAGEWRLPNVHELHSLRDSTQSSPALPANHHFEGAEMAAYWTGTSTSPAPWLAHLVNFSSTGWVVGKGKAQVHYVWPVRGG
jgi:hypothetical protein